MALFFVYVAFLFLISYDENYVSSSNSSDGVEADELELSLLKKLLEAKEAKKRTNNATNDVVNKIKKVLNDSVSEDGEKDRTAQSRIGEDCLPTDFKCTYDKKCIFGEWECDGMLDCKDETDEKDCFECVHDFQSFLLPPERVCDGIPDCVKGEDEHGCKTPCDFTEFQCEKQNPHSKCIPEEWTCDGFPDCPDFEDEVVEVCGEIEDRCGNEDFTCYHQQFCIPMVWLCDDADDCGDHSDEGNDYCDYNSRNAGDESQGVNSFSWSKWSEWSSCSSHCDGEQIRTRRCSSGNCRGDRTEIKACGEAYPCMQEPSSGCGTRVFDLPMGRILGGRDAQVHEWPWQVQIFRPGKTIPFCGGSLIRRNWILTAAHCFNNYRYEASKYTIALGRQHTSRRIEDDDAVLIPGRKLIIHEAYTRSSHRDDIALIQLEKNVPESPGINTVCLPEAGSDWLQHDPSEPPECYVTGFGINEIGKRPAVLQTAHVYLIKHEVCSTAHIYGSRVTRNMICAGHLEGGIDACQGDSGGPLVCQHPQDGMWIVVGLTSWGKGCGLPNRPGVYTRISKYIDWIDMHIKEKTR
uniref:suppressor of tumorigenicity 14 protein homolog isoform X1 n=1 Tax=Styela clava TaxID=7725 RepID=UPI001939F56F|nr:suppressor of tumorigenicity 14 protein homolog isoform X1 [Styela clava]